MLRHNVSEIITLIIFILALVLLLNPFGFWMPDALTYMMVAGVLVIFGLFSGLVLKDQARDERELAHKMRAGRIGYVAGVGVLVLAVAFEGFVFKEVDFWLILSLAAMVLARFFSVLYISNNN